MKTLIVVTQYVGFGLVAFGFVYATGMMVADEIYKRVLGTAVYYEMDALSICDVVGVLTIGSVILIASYLMEAVFKAGEASATKEEDE